MGFAHHKEVCNASTYRCTPHWWALYRVPSPLTNLLILSPIMRASAGLSREQSNARCHQPPCEVGFLTFDGVTYNLAAEDPRGIGINPLVQQIWNTYMPPSNESGCGLSRCDGDNVQGFKANLSVPQNSDFGVIRLDHDFGQKWHFMASYRYYNERVDGSGTSPLGAEQVDIGGFFNGDKLGVPVSLSKDPQLPWYFVAGLTTNISRYVTNDFHWSFLRNWWAWQRTGAVTASPGPGRCSGTIRRIGHPSAHPL
jgi:hypothetical protein